MVKFFRGLYWVRLDIIWLLWASYDFTTPGLICGWIGSILPFPLLVSFHISNVVLCTCTLVRIHSPVQSVSVCTELVSKVVSKLTRCKWRPVLCLFLLWRYCNCTFFSFSRHSSVAFMTVLLTLAHFSSKHSPPPRKILCLQCLFRFKR